VIARLLLGAFALAAAMAGTAEAAAPPLRCAGAFAQGGMVL